MQTSADYFSVPYDISAILQAERLAFRLYDALKTHSCTKYELQSIESFDYTNFSEYGIKSFGYIFNVWQISRGGNS